MSGKETLGLTWMVHVIEDFSFQPILLQTGAAGINAFIQLCGQLGVASIQGPDKTLWAVGRPFNTGP